MTIGEGLKGKLNHVVKEMEGYERNKEVLLSEINLYFKYFNEAMLELMSIRTNYEQIGFHWKIEKAEGKTVTLFDIIVALKMFVSKEDHQTADKIVEIGKLLA